MSRATLEEYYEQLELAAVELAALVELFDQIPPKSYADMMQELDVYSSGIFKHGIDEIKRVSKGLSAYSEEVKKVMG